MEFGFKSFLDYFQSCFKWGISSSSVVLSLTFGALASNFELIIGLEPVVYLAFVLLLFMEFFTGIKASLKEGKKIESKKFGRIILKILTYTILIGIINIFKTRLPVPKIFDSEINIYSWVFYTVINLIIIQLIISVFENLSRLGYKESSKIFGVIGKASEKWFKLGNNDNQ